MPYRSLKQERYFNVNRAKMEKQGVNVDEWNKASAGIPLGETAKDTPKKPAPRRGKR
jgi:hypothetical protein